MKSFAMIALFAMIAGAATWIAYDIGFDRMTDSNMQTAHGTHVDMEGETSDRIGAKTEPGSDTSESGGRSNVPEVRRTEASGSAEWPEQPTMPVPARTPEAAPEPALAPGLDAEPGLESADPLPDAIEGTAEDEVLHVVVHAVLDHETGAYRGNIAYTNRTERGVAIVADCGAFYFTGEERSADVDCAAVESMLVKGNLAETAPFWFAGERFDTGERSISVIYRRGSSDRTELSVTLDAADE